MEWFYEPQNSLFCRKQPVVQTLGRVLALVDPIHIDETANRLVMVLYRWYRPPNTNFSRASIYRVLTKSNLDLAKDTLSYYLTSSMMRLKLSTEIDRSNVLNIRAMFSNRLGMFISWYKYRLSTQFEIKLLESNFTDCVVMFSVKLQPFIELCTRYQKPIVSVLELDTGLMIILKQNLVMRVSYEFLKKQFRIYNNRYVDLDQFPVEDLHSTIFTCTNETNANKTVQIIPQTLLDSFSDLRSMDGLNHSNWNLSRTKREAKESNSPLFNNVEFTTVLAVFAIVLLGICAIAYMKG